MDNASVFVSRSVTSTVDLNWVFLVDWLIVFFSAIVFIFYFNRIIGSIVTFIITHIVWRRKKIKISIQSLKFSLLGGRIFAKNVAIITKNEMILVHTAVFTWRYWLRFTKKSQFYIEDQNLNAEINKSLPSRFNLDLVGLEIFVYNKSDAYDDIEELLKNEAALAAKKDEMSFTIRKRKHSISTIATDSEREEEIIVESESETPTEVMDSTILDFLPLDVNIAKGSFILGNETTPTIYVASYTSMHGQIDATLPASILDYYRTHYDFTANNLKVSLKTNVSFKDIDSLELKFNEARNKERTKRFASIYSGLGHSLKVLQSYFETPKVQQTTPSCEKYATSSTEDIEGWHGLARYLSTSSLVESEEDSFVSSDNKSSPDNSEYAKYSNIITTEKCKFNYYYDSQGLVPTHGVDNVVCIPDIGNKDIPPMFGLDITVSGATVYYGPWAEKQRGPLHQVLFPVLHRNSIPFKKLEAGMRRQFVNFELAVQCEDDMVFRIPHREESKDVEFVQSRQSVRSFGWLELKISKDSIVDISVALIPTSENGIDNKINAIFVQPVISTSINHDILLEADEHILDASIAYPLKWNALADWKFQNISKNVKIYLLREHITLLSDMFSDFASGDPTPYELFRPFIYRFNWTMYDYSIYLNINEKNIINNPLDKTMNTYLSFKGSDLHLITKIPLTTVYKKSNTVDYELTTSHFNLAVEHPTSSTFSNFLPTDDIGHATNFKINGCYTYFSYVEIDSIDTIIINCTCEDTILKAYGFAIKYFMSLKENYFGDNMHFQNLAEFKDSFILEEYLKEVSPYEGKRLKNETDLMFSFCVDNGCIILPCHLYDCSSHLALHFDDLDIDVRNNNYYMDLQADFSEVKGRYVSECNELEIFKNAASDDFDPEILIDDLSIHGMRIFGMPPLEPTYYCRWTFETDGIHIQSKPLFLNVLGQMAKSFIFGYSDLENSLEIPIISVLDILNLSFKCPDITISLREDDYLFFIKFSDLLFKLTDQSTICYNTFLELVIKEILVEGSLNNDQILKIVTAVELKNFIQKRDAFGFMQQQTMHVKKHDAPFHRVPFMLPDFARDRKYMKSMRSIKPSIYLPDPPIPLTNQSVEMIIERLPPRVQKKFLSLSSVFDHNPEVFDDGQKFTSNIEDFKILEELDENSAYDNIPIKLKTVEVFVSPAIANVAVRFADAMTDFNIYSFMDKLQAEFVHFFKLKEKEEIIKSKIECPFINVKIANSFNSDDFIFLGMKSLVLAMSKSSVYFDLFTTFDQLDFGMVSRNTNAVTLSLFQLSLKHSTKNRNIDFISLDSFEIFLDPHHLPYVIDEVFKMKRTIDEAITKWSILQKDIKSAGIELLYDLSKGGIDYNISHDPPCITKPSYITAFTKNHIRMDGNWMILPRLRHTLLHLPAAFLNRKNEMFKKRLWEAPRSAESEVSVIFGNWRCWDNHKTRDNFIFQRVFGSIEKLKMKLLNTTKISVQSISVDIRPFHNAFIIQNLSFFINEDRLKQNLKDLASPLLDQPIQNSLDFNLKIEYICLDFRKLCQIIPVIHDLLDETKHCLRRNQSRAPDEYELDSTASLKDVERYEAVNAPQLITLNFSLGKLCGFIGIDKSVLEFNADDAGFTASLIKAEEILSCTLNFKSAFFNSEFIVDKMNFFEVICKSSELTLVNTGTFMLGNSKILISNNLLKLNFPQSSDHLLKILNVLFHHEYLIIKPLINSNKFVASKPDASQNSSSEDFLDSLSSNWFSSLQMDISVSAKITNFVFHVELLSPFYSDFRVSDMAFISKLGNYGFLADFFISKYAWFIHSQNTDIFTYSNSTINKCHVTVITKFLEGFYDTLVDFDIDNVIFDLNQNLVDCVSRAQSDINLALRNLRALKAQIKKFQNICQSANSAKPKEIKHDSGDIFNSLKRLFPVSFRFKIDYISSRIILNRNKLFLDCFRLSLLLKTYDKEAKRFGPYGTAAMNLVVGFENSHFSSSIFDSRLKMEIINPVSSNHKLQRLNIEMDYLRLMLNPLILEEFIEVYGDVVVYFDPFLVEKKEAVADTTNFEEKLDTILSFFSINVVAKNFCAGWLFDEHIHSVLNEMPGIIFGFDTSSLSCAKGAGKIQTSGLYLSIAHGSTFSSFYSLHGEKTSVNRAYFPLFDLIYIIASDKENVNFKARVTGQLIDFKFQTNIFSVIEHLWSSISSLQEKYAYVQNVIEISRKEQATKHSQIGQKIVKKFPASPVVSLTKCSKKTTISCAFEFAGASFNMHNPHIEINGAIPILNLHAPQLSSAFKYIHDASAIKTHDISLSALVSETNNKLTCLCVPILQDIIKAVENMMKKSSSKSKDFTFDKNSKVAANHDVSSAEQDNIKGVDFVHLSEKINVNFSLKIEPQRLALSCEPRANIEAVVALEDIHFIIKTDHDVLCAVLSVRSVKSELKHAYSKVTSGSIFVNNLTINCTLAKIEGNKEFVVVASLDEVDAFVNIQQRQDLDLFKDLWLPHNFNNSLLVRKSKPASSKTFASMLREVSTTTAFPWILTLLVSKFSAKINLGSSLGDLSVDVCNFMAISTKSMNWNQNLKFEFEAINIEAFGRLSGLLKIKNIRMTSAIAWKDEKTILDIPLVLLSVGFRSLETKISLDFHPFFISEILNLNITVHNQRDKEPSQNKLKSNLNIGSFKVFMTALAASNFVDVYTIGFRIRQDIKTSYKQVLNEAQINITDPPLKNDNTKDESAQPINENEAVQENFTPSATFLSMIQKLKTYVTVDIGLTKIQISPTSLFDSQAMSLKIGSLNSMFYQSNLEGIENRLLLDLADITVSLSTYKNEKLTLDILNEIGGIAKYINLSDAVVDDNLFVFPSLTIRMNTFQNLINNIVKYNYFCKFGGKVDIKWKIGSVYFIREMWITHATSLGNRLMALKIYTSDEFCAEIEENYKESALETINLEDRLKDVESDKKFIYNAITEPNIETPQLKDLGNATPPLEWFGVHRDKFPNLTHQVVIMGLQKMIRKVEENYSNVLK